ncbi:SH3 domain-containing protein [Streptomyces sp. NPDC001340]
MPFSKLSFRRAVSGLTAATALALGATLMAAPTASAVGSSGCTKNIRDTTYTVVQYDHADMHTGPGNNYRVKKSVYMGNKVRVYCTAKGGSWYYGKFGSTYGWMEEHAFF